MKPPRYFVLFFVIMTPIYCIFALGLSLILGKLMEIVLGV